MYTHQFQQNARIPSYALSYLINGDASGLPVEDKLRIDKWYQLWQDVADRVNGTVVIAPVDDREFYTKYPEFGLPCQCTECDILVLSDNKDINDDN